ncbi:hypothetical protein DRQ53_03740 [bacterium]|nr:MAG: hypothetical protein DRQ53_03740 [bacterium]
MFRGWRKALLLAWSVALCAHWVWSFATQPEPVQRGSGLWVERQSGPLWVAFSDTNPEATDALLLLHGSPGSAGDFDQLRAALDSGLRVICVDLPGFGASTRDLDDYSFTAHAGDMLALLDSLGIEQVHVVGMSMGGGVALEMIAAAPARVASITLLASIGFQEYELTGDYHTNHALHLLQAAVVWSIEHLVPHFGTLDSDSLAWSYVRNFTDSDQRRLADPLLRWTGPALVIHGQRDFLVPVAAARAHSLALSNAHLEVLKDSSHFIIWTAPDSVATLIQAHVRSSGNVASGLSALPRSRPTADQLRGPGRWILITTAAVGALIVPPLASWWFISFVLLGRLGILQLALALGVGAALRGLFHARDGRLRSAVRLSGGTVIHFVLLAASGRLIDWRTPGGALLALLLWALGWWLWQHCNATSRGRLRGRWLRWRRWEYWPSWVVYLPILPELLWRARSMGGIRLATCVNPASELGGLVGESKAEILTAFGDRPEIARWQLIEPGALRQRRASVADFAASLPQSWPLALKPDRGERGAGVTIARDDAQLDQALATIQIPLIAQEYIPGVEYGVFWAADPEGGSGQVFSVSHKACVLMHGNGQSSVLELLLAEDRVLPLLDYHLRMHAPDLVRVPSAGEVIAVSELGTHSLGATFMDSMHLATPQLAAALETIMADAPGLDFGRFDLRVPSEAMLRRGEGLKIIEFNGLSAEAAHIYDPGHPVSLARSVLLEQWLLAMRVGRANFVRGVRPASWWQVVRALSAHASDRELRGA